MQNMRSDFFIRGGAVAILSASIERGYRNRSRPPRREYSMRLEHLEGDRNNIYT